MSVRPISECFHVFGNSAAATIPIVAAVPGRAISIYKGIITASATTNLSFQDTTGAAVGQTFPHTALKAMILDVLDNDDPWFTVSAGMGFQLAQSGTATIGFDIWYLTYFVSSSGVVGGQIYTAEDGVTPYTAEDGVTAYVT